MLFHVPGMILKMILINPTWIFGIIPGVLKTILAISREVYYFPSPGRHFRGQPADLCTTQPTHAQRRAGTVESGPFEWTQQYQCNASFNRDTRTSV